MSKLEHTKTIKLGNMERETFKKYLLIYGYGRWSKIKKKSF
jgi:hypothetical protein